MVDPMGEKSGRSEVRLRLLEWYRPRRALYPWRSGASPYAVLVSEVMLQQTQAPRVAKAFRAFMARFPTLDALAEAPLSEVLRAWSGLGYNRRAAALQEAARRILRDHGGRVPADPAVLRTLPGVGPYTAAAVASVAHGVPVAAVDTNVARVVSRFALAVDPPGPSRARVLAEAQRWVDRADPGAWNQALMDLGREVCRPVPRCGACPLAGPCRRSRPGGSAPGGRPRPPVPRPPRFEGSIREARGAVLRALVRKGPGGTLGRIAGEAGLSLERAAQAVRALAADGLVRAGPAARDGRPRGRVRLPH